MTPMHKRAIESTEEFLARFFAALRAPAEPELIRPIVCEPSSRYPLTIEEWREHERAGKGTVHVFCDR